MRPGQIQPEPAEPRLPQLPRARLSATGRTRCMAKLFRRPSEQEVGQTAVERFRKRVNQQCGTSLADYWDLHKWTCQNANAFWNLAWDELGVLGEKGQQPLFDNSRPMRETQHLLPHARLNFAENALLAHGNANSDKPAIICCAEGKDTHQRTVSWKQLHAEVAQLANALKAAGVQTGDAVAAFTPNNAEAVIFVLAAAAVGAVSSTVAAEYAEEGVLDRFEQIRPKILLTADCFRYNGKTLPLLPKAFSVAKRLQQIGLQQIVVVGQLQRNRQPAEKLPQNVGGLRVQTYSDFLARQPAQVEFARLAASAPCWVLYSSGTTGKPKAIVHSIGGMILCGKMLGAFHNALDEQAVVLQYTTFSWMMAQWMIQCLLAGSAIVCYDGSPFAPEHVIFDLVDRHHVTYLGVSPRFLQVLLSKNASPRTTHSLASLTTVGTTGAPMKDELYDFIGEQIKADLYVNNCSGGTDICSAFVASVPSLPVYKSELGVPVLGIALEVWSDEGEVVPDGEEGNMVITQPFPNAPLGFQNDPDSSRFHDAYFNSFERQCVWNHSDWLVRNPQTKGYTILGRSDATLNAQGVRFGSSELYTAVEDLKDVVDDCIAVAQKLPTGDERVVLFVKTVEGKPLREEDISRLKQTIRSKRTTRHVPAVILACPDIPYTATNKRIEIAVKKVINGTPITKVNRSGMANPDSLEWFVDRPELRLGQARAKL